MVDRLMKHFKPEELMGYFDGTLEERRVREHLITCVLCRSRLRDLALIRIIMAPPGEELPDEHLPPQTLARYVGDSLSKKQNKEVEEHMGRCRRCLCDLVSLKTAMNMPLDLDPPEDLVERLKEELGLKRTAARE